MCPEGEEGQATWTGVEAVVLDVDGTLVDSNYQHVTAWQRAFQEFGFDVEAWRIHRRVGMGGDQLVPALVGGQGEREHGDEIRKLESELFEEMLPRVRPFEGATEMIRSLKEDDFVVVLASSATRDEVEHYIELLGVAELHDGFTTASDVEATKPEPDLVGVAIEKANGLPAMMVGDSVWDVEAAKRAGLKTIGLLTGGFGEAELFEAGASAVVEGTAQVKSVLEEHSA